MPLAGEGAVCVLWLSVSISVRDAGFEMCLAES